MPNFFCTLPFSQPSWNTVKQLWWILVIASYIQCVETAWILLRICIGIIAIYIFILKQDILEHSQTVYQQACFILASLHIFNWPIIISKTHYTVNWIMYLYILYMQISAAALLFIMLTMKGHIYCHNDITFWLIAPGILSITQMLPWRWQRLVMSMHGLGACLLFFGHVGLSD